MVDEGVVLSGHFSQRDTYQGVQKSIQKISEIFIYVQPTNLTIQVLN